MTDIFYNEFNRWRDKKNTESEKIEGIKTALRKYLKRFNIIWEDQLLGNYFSPEEKKKLFKELSEDILDIAVEVDEVLKDKEILENLRELSKLFKKTSNRHNGYPETVNLELGQARTKISEIEKKLND